MYSDRSSPLSIALPRNPNAWQPSVFGKKDDSQTVIYNHLKSFLNKITPDNFDRIVAQTRELEVKEESQVRQCMDMYIYEPFFRRT